MRNPFVAPTIRQVFFGRDEQDVPDESFFSFIRLPNGSFKTTQANRLTDVDEHLATILSQTSRHYDVLDLGCSSGTCTVELTDTLRRRGVVHQMYASDLYLHAERFRLLPFDMLFGTDDALLQVDVGRCAFPNSPPSKLSAVVFFLARCLMPCCRWWGWKTDQISLLSRAARQSPIRFSEGDLFGDAYRAAPAQRFDVVRVANLLNASYFSPAEIQEALANLSRLLRPEGLLVLARTDQGVNYAGIYRKQDAAWQLVDDLNGHQEFSRWMSGG